MNFQGQITGPGYGFVYVMSYPGSGMVKIGHSLYPDMRASQIGGTLAPEEPVLECYFWCSERREAVERKAHSLQASVRGNGEWFHISVTDAMQAIQEAAAQVGVSIQLIFERQQYEAQLARERAEAAATLAAEQNRRTSENAKRVQEEEARQVRLRAEWDARWAKEEELWKAKRAARASRSAIRKLLDWIHRPV